MNRDVPRILIALIVFALTVTGCVAPIAVPATENPESAEYAEFLADNFGVSFQAPVTQDAFLAALRTAIPEAASVELPAEVDMDDFSALEAVLMAVHLANLDELGYTYPEEKVAETLAGWSTAPEDLALARRQELAAAVDAGLLDAGWQMADMAAAPAADFATELLGNTLLVTGNYKDFLGRSTDPDIINKLMYAWNSFDQVSMPELQESANVLIADGVITGYNIKRTAQNANGAQARTLVYGHANMEHAKQLIGLLRSEGLEADVMLEPKTSAFLYLEEWGEPTESPGFQVEPLEGGNGIAYAKEYDLVFEFDDPADRDRFDEVIKQYAKKNEQDQPGLLIGSWWQPLYSSRVAVGDYIPVKNNVVSGDQFYIQSFSLDENSSGVIAAFETLYPDAEVSVHDLWVNEAFYNYLMGEAQ
jgi:hypothetical protein